MYSKQIALKLTHCHPAKNYHSNILSGGPQLQYKSYTRPFSMKTQDTAWNSWQSRNTVNYKSLLEATLIER